VAQPTFYVHFRDMDDALEQAAELAASEILEGLTGSGAHAGSDDPDERIRAAYRSTLDALLRDARTTELFLRHRRDVQTPFGRRFQEVAEQTRQQLRRQLEPLGSPQGPGAPGSVAHAELTLGMTLGAVEGLLDGRIPDRESAVEALVQLSYSALSG
jgi:AcrR family transcriptional regulator